MTTPVSRVLQQVLLASDWWQDTTSPSNNVIPFMAWEQHAASTLALSKDQLRFILAQFASVLAGWGIRVLHSHTARHVYALVTGLLLIYYPFGAGLVHVLPPIVFTYLGMRLAPRKCGTLAWYATFPYLTYLHLGNATRYHWALGQLDFSGCLMVLVLKLISVAVCYQDHYKKKEDMNEFQQVHALHKCPSILQLLSYSFSLGNLLAGPYFEFTEHLEFMELKGVWSPDSKQPVPSLVLPSLNCLGQAVLFAALYLNLLPVFNVATFKSAWLIQSPIHMRMATIFMTAFTNQFKYCFIWKLSELSLILAGFDFIGWDPQTKKPIMGRGCNVRWFDVMACDSARRIPQYWNIGTGQFMRRYVYERLTQKGRRPGFTQLLLTQLTSGLWHGLYPGWLCFFTGTVLWIHFSTIIWKAETKFLPQAVAKSLPWVAVKRVWTHFVLNYMATAAMVLELPASLELYRSIYFWPHMVMVAGCILGPMINGGKGAQASKKVC